MNLYLSSLSGLTFFKGCRIVQRRLERWFDPKQQTQAHSISDFSCFVFSSFLKSTTFKLNIHTNNHFICIYEFHLNYINWVASWTWNRRYNNLNSANCSQGRNTIKIIISTVYYTAFRMFLSFSTRLSFIKTRHNQSSFFNYLIKSLLSKSEFQTEARFNAQDWIT